jgi:hypothetical protein
MKFLIDRTMDLQKLADQARVFIVVSKLISEHLRNYDINKMSNTISGLMRLYLEGHI